MLNVSFELGGKFINTTKKLQGCLSLCLGVLCMLGEDSTSGLPLCMPRAEVQTIKVHQVQESHRRSGPLSSAAASSAHVCISRGGKPELR